MIFITEKTPFTNTVWNIKYIILKQVKNNIFSNKVWNLNFTWFWRKKTITLTQHYLFFFWLFSTTV